VSANINQYEEIRQILGCGHCHATIWKKGDGKPLIYNTPMTCESCGENTSFGKPYDVESFLENAKRERSVSNDR